MEVLEHGGQSGVGSGEERDDLPLFHGRVPVEGRRRWRSSVFGGTLLTLRTAFSPSGQTKVGSESETRGRECLHRLTSRPLRPLHLTRSRRTWSPTPRQQQPQQRLEPHSAPRQLWMRGYGGGSIHRNGRIYGNPLDVRLTTCPPLRGYDPHQTTPKLEDPLR